MGWSPEESDFCAFFGTSKITTFYPRGQVEQIAAAGGSK